MFSKIKLSQVLKINLKILPFNLAMNSIHACTQEKDSNQCKKLTKRLYV